MIPATVCRAGFAAPVSGSEVATIGTPRRIRHHRTRQPLAGSSPRLSAGNRSTVCRLSAIPATVRRHHRTRASRGNRSTVANIERRRNAAQPFDRSPRPASDDSGGQPIRQHKPRRNRSRRAAGFRRTSNAASHPALDRKRRPFDRWPEASAVRPWRPCAACQRFAAAV